MNLPKFAIPACGLLLLWTSSVPAAPLGFEEQALRLRESVLLRVEPRLTQPSRQASSRAGNSRRYPWKNNIVTTVFWIGESAAKNNPVANLKSSWDVNWKRNYGGYDDPDPRARHKTEYRPARFIPRQNPFYVALPYNDVTRGRTKPEAPRVIPWFREAFVKAGRSVCKGRWVVVRHRGREAYGQWEDCGPFRTDHWQYVFGTHRPLPNLNQGAGLDVSPAMRDYLRMGGKDVCDWRFVEFREVPSRGPWARYGDNNTFVQQRHRSDVRFAESHRSDNRPN